MAAKKLTRKEIVQEDVIRKTLTETSSWAVENSRLIVGGIVALIVIGFAFIGWETYSSNRNEVLQTAFADALEMYHGEIKSGEDEAETSPLVRPKYEFESESERSEKALSAFRQLAADYPSHTLGQLSLYYVGIIECETGNAEAGMQNLQTVVAEADDPEVRDLVGNYLAEQYASREQYADAVALLEEILDSAETNVPKQSLLLRVGEIKEVTGDLEGAMEAYRRISNEFAGSASAQQANDKIRRLEPKVQQASNNSATDEPAKPEE